MTLPIKIPPKTPLDSKLTSENMTKLECKNKSAQFSFSGSRIFISINERMKKLSL